MVDVDSGVPEELRRASAPDVQATYCATLVDQWIRHGVCHAVVAPGSRSTPMALALAERSEMTVHVVHDERVAAFVALGLGVGSGPGTTGTPALLLCTSGTAAANFFPAVVEAGLSAVPLIVLTADRPAELRGVGAPQTIDQVDLYGRHVRWAHDPGVPEPNGANAWRSLASTAWKHAEQGPVQLNLAFREPLVGRAGSPPPVVDSHHDDPGQDDLGQDDLGQDEGQPARAFSGRSTSSVPVDPVPSSDPVPASFDRERGVILVGGRHGVEAEQVLELGRRTSWPIVADPTSSMRHLADVGTADALLRSARFARDFAADTIVRVGRPSTSKVLAQWSARPGVTLIQVGGPGRIDPAHNVAARCTLDDLLRSEPSGATGRSWLADWRSAEEHVERVMTERLGSVERLDEPATARILADNLPEGAQLTVSSSMPVRDLEWFGGPRARAHSNRGANGIDGVVSTALGRALGQPTNGAAAFVLIGDLAFVHDSNALVALSRRDADLRIVVVDNDGGGIFSFLSQAKLLEHDRFEQLFGTPLGSDVLALAAAHGVATASATTPAELVAQLARPGPWVCRVVSDRARNVVAHEAIHDEIVRALEQHLSDRVET